MPFEINLFWVQKYDPVSKITMGKKLNDFEYIMWDFPQKFLPIPNTFWEISSRLPPLYPPLTSTHPIWWPHWIVTSLLTPYYPYYTRPLWWKHQPQLRLTCPSFTDSCSGQASPSLRRFYRFLSSLFRKYFAVLIPFLVAKCTGFYSLIFFHLPSELHHKYFIYYILWLPLLRRFCF